MLSDGEIQEIRERAKRVATARAISESHAIPNSVLGVVITNEPIEADALALLADRDELRGTVERHTLASRAALAELRQFANDVQDAGHWRFALRVEQARDAFLKAYIGINQPMGPSDAV